jgi:hypothetical protein
MKLDQVQEIFCDSSFIATTPGSYLILYYPNSMPLAVTW